MKVRNWTAVGCAILALGFGLVACGGEPEANALKAGDCIEGEISGAVGEDNTVSCDDAHTAEVFATFDLEGDDFPGTDQVLADAAEGCQGQRFEDYVGVSYDVSESVASPLVPSEDSWNNNDDRTVICLAVSADGSETEGSVEGAGV